MVLFQHFAEHPGLRKMGCPGHSAGEDDQVEVHTRTVAQRHLCLHSDAVCPLYGKPPDRGHRNVRTRTPEHVNGRNCLYLLESLRKWNKYAPAHFLSSSLPYTSGRQLKRPFFLPRYPFKSRLVFPPEIKELRNRFGRSLKKEFSLLRARQMWLPDMPRSIEPVEAVE